MNAMERLLGFLTRLEAHGIRYSLAHDRADALTVCVQRPTERWEVGFRADGTVDVETFAGVGEVVTGDKAEILLERFFATEGTDA